MSSKSLIKFGNRKNGFITKLTPQAPAHKGFSKTKNPSLAEENKSVPLTISYTEEELQRFARTEERRKRNKNRILD